MMLNKIALCLGALLYAGAVSAQEAPSDEQTQREIDRTVTSQHHELRVRTVASGLEHPWGIALLPDGRFLITERDPGQLRIGNRDGDLSAPVRNVPKTFRYEGDTPRSQAGLFDVKLHPGFADNRIIYLSYSRPTERGAALTVSRARLADIDGEPRLENVETVFEMKEEDQDSSGLHFGGRMAIHPQDGSIFLTVGERRNLSRAQDPEDQAGSILRFDSDGNPHPDNPFRGGDGDPYVYAIGARNPQGITFAPDTGEVWIVDHGPERGDEINRIERGRNYGWPYITGGVDYSGAPIGVGTEHEGMESPVHIFDETIAPSGLVFYDGNRFDEWQGDMLIGGLVAEAIVRVRVENERVVEEEHIEVGRRVRDVQVAEDGALWLVTDHEDGEVLRVTTARGDG
jgi:aldose sugar dehydrogenase